MTRLWGEGTPVEVVAGGDGEPVQFVWQGRLHRVLRVVQASEVETDWWEPAGPVARAYYAVITDSELLCVLYRELAGQGWRVSKLYD
jgi:hypothetical protein